MRSNFQFILLLGLVSLGFSGCTKTDHASQTSPQTESVQENITDDEAALRLNYGRELVSENCTSCHAIGPSDDSPRADAPPLRTVLATYDPEDLTIDLVEHHHIGAPDMPDFDFGPKGSDAVVAYLKSIQSDE